MASLNLRAIWPGKTLGVPRQPGLEFIERRTRPVPFLWDSSPGTAAGTWLIPKLTMDDFSIVTLTDKRLTSMCREVALARGISEELEERISVPALWVAASRLSGNCQLSNSSNLKDTEPTHRKSEDPVTGRWHLCREQFEVVY